METNKLKARLGRAAAEADAIEGDRHYAALLVLGPPLGHAGNHCVIRRDYPAGSDTKGAAEVAGKH